jgi:DNA-binding HxlR family transcriptional regulator
MTSDTLTMYDMQPEEHSRSPGSALEAALERVGDRWSLLVVEALLAGPRRFNELIEQLPGIAPNILADRLRRLEAGRVLTSRPYSRRPVRLVYHLTQEGEELAGVLRLLAQWGGGESRGADGVQHLACGSFLEAHWFCPTCARPVDDEEASVLRFA